MKKTALILNLVLALSFLLSACGAQPTAPGVDQVAGETPTAEPTPSVDWDRSPEAPVITVTYCCGFVMEIVRYNYIPEAMVWGDGRIVWSQIDDMGRRRVLEGQLTEDQMARLLAGIKDAGFFGWKELYSDMNGPTDMPNKCIQVAADGRQHQVCEYWQGAPEAFHVIFENLRNGTGVSGVPYVPERGYLIAHRIPRPDQPLNADEFMVWNAEATQIQLEDAVTGTWLEGEALLRAWDMVNARTYGGMVLDGEDYFMLSIQVPELSREEIPAQ
jgi:hypothetical protein